MEDRPVPFKWEGQRVVASIIESGDYQNSTPLPLAAPEREGVLEEVSELGILASLVVHPEEEEAVSTFYPWSAVLSLRLQG